MTDKSGAAQFAIAYWHQGICTYSVTSGYHGSTYVVAGVQADGQYGANALYGTSVQSPKTQTYDPHVGLHGEAYGIAYTWYP